MAKLTFEDCITYAEKSGAQHREGESKAANLTQTYWFNPWRRVPIMVLYEAPKRVLFGHKEEEVCWICIDPEGNLYNEAARNIRRMDKRPGFGFSNWGVMVIEAVIGENKIIQQEA